MSFIQAQPLGEVPSIGRTHGRAFQALFGPLLRSNTRLVGVLQAHGYDPGDPQESYPSDVWKDCLEATRCELFGHCPKDVGLRALGRLFVVGFSKTPIGRVFDGVAYTGRAYLVRVPALLKLARPDLEPELSFETERRVRLAVRGRHANADFMAGLVEARVRERGVAAHAEVTHAAPSEYELLITW